MSLLTDREIQTGLSLPAESAWPERQPLESPGETPPLLDTYLIPEPLRAQAVDEARRLGRLPEHIFLAQLVSAAALIGTTAMLQVKARDTGFTVPSILWGGLIGPPSIGKSPALRKGTKHLDDIQKRLDDEYAATTATRSGRHAALQDRMVVASKKIKSAEQKGRATETEEATEQLAKLHEELAEVERPARRHIINDATMEKVHELLAENPGGLLLIRDELTALFRAMDKKGHETDRQFLLEAWGGRSLTADRIGRGTIRADSTALSILGGIQPDEFDKLVNPLAGGTGGDGLFSRFQLLVCMDLDLLPFEEDIEPDEAASNRAAGVFRQLARRRDNHPAGFRETIRLDERAQVHMDEWRRGLDHEVREHQRAGRSVWAAHLGKAGEVGARVALVLHMMDRADGHTSPAVTLDQAERATRLMRFFLQHAAIAFKAAHHPQLAKLRHLTRALEEGKVAHDAPTFTVAQFVKSIKTVAEAERLLSTLEELGWVRLKKVQRPGVRSSMLVELHPDLRPYDGSGQRDAAGLTN